MDSDKRKRSSTNDGMEHKEKKIKLDEDTDKRRQSASD